MTSRERLRLALEHKEPDRVPVDNNGIVSNIHEVAYKNLIDYLGLKEEIVILDPVQRIVLASEDVLRTLGVDTRYIYPNAPSWWRYEESGDGTWIDEFGAKYKRVGFYADCVDSPLKGKSLEEVKSYKLPDPTHASRFTGLKEKAKSLYESTDYALVSGAMICVDYLRWMIRGLEDSLMDLSANPDITDYLLDSIVDWMTAFGGALLEEIGEYIEFFWVGDDWGMQQGPFYSPEAFRRIFKPRLAKLIEHLKTKTKAKCAYHCCGSVYWVIEDMIEIGVDILHPIQPSASGNEDTAKIKREFGDRICFHGGTNNQSLFHGNLIDLQVDTLERIKDLAPGGGYIFSSGHNIQANCPPENIIGLFDVAKRFGKYPIDFEMVDKEIERLRALKR